MFAEAGNGVGAEGEEGIGEDWKASFVYWEGWDVVMFLKRQLAPQSIALARVRGNRGGGGVGCE